MGLDDLAQYLDPQPKTGGYVIDFFTPYNPSIENIISFLRMISFRGGHPDPDVRPGHAGAINFNIEAFIALVTQFTRDYMFSTQAAFRILQKQHNLDCGLFFLSGRIASVISIHFTLPEAFD